MFQCVHNQISAQKSVTKHHATVLINLSVSSIRVFVLPTRNIPREKVMLNG